MTAATLKRVFVLLLLVCAGGLYAVDLDDLGYEVIRSRPDGERILYEVRDSAGNEFVAVYAGDLTSSQGERLDRIVEQFFAFSYVAIDRLRVVFSEDRIEILAVPASFAYEGVQLARYMPAGMTFYYVDALEYDFRIRVDNIFVRISGQFFDEDQFADRIARAVENPVAYMQTQDPQFIFQRFTELEDRLTQLEDRLTQLERDSAARREALQGEIDQLERRYERTAAELDDLEDDYDDLSRSHRDLQRAHENLAVAHSALRDDHESLREDHATLLSAHEALRADYRALLSNHQELQVAHDELETEFDDTVEVATAEFNSLRDDHQALALSHAELQELNRVLREEHDTLRTEHLALLERHQGLREEFNALAADTTDLAGQFELLRFAAVTANNTGFLGIRFPVPDPATIALIIETKFNSPDLDVDGVFDALREQDVDVQRKLVQVVFEFYFNDYGLDDE